MYSVGQLSARTGLTVRTLHYYDELGLLKPSVVSEAGYRYYTDDDMMRLHQIVALKKLGFTLAKIRRLMAEPSTGPDESSWMTALHMELEAVLEQQNRLAVLEKLIRATLHSLELKGMLDAEDIFMFIQAVRREGKPFGSQREVLFSDDEWHVIDQLPTIGSDDPRTTEWLRLLRDVREHVNEPADSPVSRRLAERIAAIAASMYQGNDELAIKHWELMRPGAEEPPIAYGLDAPTMEYIDRIMTARYGEAGLPGLAGGDSDRTPDRGEST